MTPQRNHANEPGPRLTRDEKWLQSYRRAKEQLKGARRLLPEAHLRDNAKSDINSAKKELSEVLKWVKAVKNPRWRPYFGSLQDMSDAIYKAIGELIISTDVINYYNEEKNKYNPKRTIEEIRANCMRELHKSLGKCRWHIEQALKEFYI